MNSALTARTASYARLPLAPTNASPVPWLTSIHSTSARGPYGDACYRGNCSGYLIKDLLRFYGAQRVLDPMSGGGTCADVCKELDIPCTSLDLRAGQDAAAPASDEGLGSFDFIWMHPPYWKMIRYNDDPRCLSNAETLDQFIDRMRAVLRCCRGVLKRHGHIAVLIGGYSHRWRYMPLSALTTAAAIEEGLWPACTEIIRFQHGNTSSHRVYTSSFIPGLHDTCTVYGIRHD